MPPRSGLYRRLFSETARPHLTRYGLVAILLLAISATTAAMAWLIEDVVDGVFVQGDAGRLTQLALAIFAVFTVRGLATYGSAVLLARIGNQIVAGLQERLLRHLQQQNLAFYETHTLGEVAIRFSANANSARSAVELIVQSIGRDLVTLVGLTTVMVLQSPTMALTGLLILLPAWVLIRWLTAQARQVSKETIAANTRMIGHIRELHQGVRVIKAFTLQSHIAKRMLIEVCRVRDLANHSVRYAALTAPMLDGLIGALLAGVVVFAGMQIADGNATPGAIVSFLTALLLAYEPARRLARFQVQLQSHVVGVELMFDFLDQPATEPDTPRPPVTLPTNDIHFASVNFRHDETPALKDTTLDCPAGKVTALVGASGSGKSTIVDLLLGLRSADAGMIHIGGIPIDTLPLTQLRETIAVVPQQTFLFDTTIRENIRWGRPDATDAEVEAAARMANAHDFITGDPQGYERQITDTAGLSGGERQRIAIARAMLKDAPILVLDEATSALDPDSEAAIQTSLDTLKENRTTLVIAHRLSTIRDADLIHVLQDGSVVESGRHLDLILRGGAYARLYGDQASKGGTPAR